MKRIKRTAMMMSLVLALCTASTTYAEEDPAVTVSTIMDLTLAEAESISGYTVATMDAKITTGDSEVNIAYISNGYYETMMNDDVTYVSTASLSESDTGIDVSMQTDLYAEPSENGYMLRINSTEAEGESTWRDVEISGNVSSRSSGHDWILDEEVYDLDDYDYYRLYEEKDGITVSYFVEMETGILTWIHAEASDVDTTQHAQTYLAIFGYDSSFDSFEITDFSFDCNLSYDTVDGIEIPSETEE